MASDSENAVLYALWTARADKALMAVNAYKFAGWWMSECFGRHDGIDLNFSMEHSDTIRHMPEKWCRIFEKVAERCHRYAERFQPRKDK